MLKPEKLYTIQDIADRLNLSESAVTLRTRQVGVRPRIGKNKKAFYTQSQYDKVVNWERNPKPADAFYIYELSDRFLMSKENLCAICNKAGIDLHYKNGSYDWITAEDLEKLEQIIADREARRKQIQAEKKAKVNKYAKKVYYKISVSNDGLTYYVKACSLSLDDAMSIQDSLLTMGIQARATPHVESKVKKVDVWNF